MAAKKNIKKSFYLPPDLVEAWEKFHPSGRNYSSSAAGAIVVWLALTPDIREKAIREAYQTDVKEAITKIKSCFCES